MDWCDEFDLLNIVRGVETSTHGLRVDVMVCRNVSSRCQSLRRVAHATVLTSTCSTTHLTWLMHRVVLPVMVVDLLLSRISG